MRIVPLPAHNPRPWTGDGSITYLVGRARPVLIDAGEGHAPHLDALDEALGTAPLQRVIVTHAHVDHAAGAPQIARRHPGAAFWKLPWPERDPKYDVAWRTLKDGDEIDVDGGALVVVHTPGHAPDHIALFAPDTGVLFAGDLVMNGGTVVIPASAGGNLRQYLKSLRDVLEMQPRRILPAHGPPIDNPPALLRSYITHRAMRERQIVDAMAGEAWTVADLTARIYASLDATLATAATESVTAHLVKLQEEGRAAAERDDDGQERWRLVPGSD